MSTPNGENDEMKTTPAPHERVDRDPAWAVSVNVVTHNQRRWIHETLQSVAAQQCSFPFEIVIADDASTDGTREAALEWAATYPGVCRVLPPSDRLGVSANHRRAFAAARGDAIAVIEGDDVWIRSDKLERQYAALAADASLVLVACRHLIVDGTGQAGFLSPLLEAAAFRTRLTSEDLADSNWFGTFSTTMFRASAVQRVDDEVWEAGPYDWLLAMAVTEWGDALLLGEVGTAYRQHHDGVWSSESAHSRARTLRSLLPRYRAVLGGRLDAALSRVEWHLNDGISQMNEVIEAAPAPDRPAQDFAIPLAQPDVIPCLSMIVVVDSTSTFAGDLEGLIGNDEEPYEIIIVDIADSPAGADILGGSDPRVRRFRVPHETDRVSALNLGILQARADMVAIMDPGLSTDRRLLIEHLERMVAQEIDVIVALPEGARAVDGKARSQRLFFDSLDEDWSLAIVRVSALMEGGLFDPLLGDHCFVDRWSDLTSRTRTVLTAEAWGASRDQKASRLTTAVEALDRIIDRVVDSTEFDSFRDLMRPYPADDAARRECLMIAALLADTGASAQRRWSAGARRLRRALENPVHRKILRTEHRITEFDLHRVEDALSAPSTGRGGERLLLRSQALVRRVIHRLGRSDDRLR